MEKQILGGGGREKIEDFFPPILRWMWFEHIPVQLGTSHQRDVENTVK